MAKEQLTINTIEQHLILANRYYVNVHGSTFSRNGTPDILTHDKGGTFVGIEAKQLGKAPVVSQWARGLEILRSGGRFIVAYEDFTAEALDSHTFPIFKVKKEDGFEQFELLHVKAFNQTTEVQFS